MIISELKKTFTWWQISILGLLIFFPLFNMLPNSNLGSDASNYIFFDQCRPPLYPLFIGTFRIFGEKYLIFARWAQTILNFIALLYAGLWMRKNLEMPNFSNFLILFSMIALISLHTHTLVWIFSEGIAFPIFIVTFLLLVENCKTLDTKKFTWLVVGTSLLTLTRHQFYYLYFILVFYVIWHLWRRESGKKIFSALSTIILSILITFSLAQIYYYWIDKNSVPSSNAAAWKYSGWRVLVQPMYLANNHSEKYFSNSIEKNLFVSMKQHLERDQYTRNSAAPLRNNNNLLAAEYHYMSILGMLQDSIRTAIKQNSPKDLSADQVDKLLFHISKILFFQQMKENITFYIYRVTHYAGGFWIFLSSLIAFLVMSYRIVIDRKWHPSIKQAFILTSILFILTNAAFVAIVETESIRYFYYSIFLYFCLFGLLAKEFIKEIPLRKPNVAVDVRIDRHESISQHGVLDGMKALDNRQS